MKKILYCSILAILLLNSCSSDDNEGQITNAPVELPPTEEPFFLKLTYDGVPVLDGIHYPAWNPFYPLRRNYDGSFEIMAKAELGCMNLTIKFNEWNDLIYVTSYNYYPDYYPTLFSCFNYRKAASEHFHFELESFDPVNHTVRGNFSGRLYKNSIDLNSDFVEISGSFYNNYSSDSGITGSRFYGVSANIAGQSWHSTEMPLINEEGYGYSDPLAPGIKFSQFISDDRYRIIIGHETVVGIRNFSDTSSGTFVRLSKYNPATDQYENYNTISGNIVIASVTPLAPYVKQYKGVFSFTAVNPNDSSDIIQVTEGTFNFNNQS